MKARQDSRVSGRPGLPAAVVIALVLAVSAGIIGMHHLGGGGHHSMDSMSEHAADSSVSSDGPAHTAADMTGMSDSIGTDVMAGRDAAAVLQAAPGDAATSLRAASGVGIMLSACVTALLGGLLGLLVYLTLGWRARRHDDPAFTLVRTDGPRPGRGPPRDLLAQLCVLRT